jgi:hypothetical protein
MGSAVAHNDGDAQEESQVMYNKAEEHSRAHVLAQLSEVLNNRHRGTPHLHRPNRSESQRFQFHHDSTSLLSFHPLLLLSLSSGHPLPPSLEEAVLALQSLGQRDRNLAILADVFCIGTGMKNGLK